jgi:glycosyltransferase involved in cell wall biosynthesis
MPEIVTPDTGVLVAPGDAQAMAEGVRAFYDSDPDRLGRHARLRAESEYTWTATMRGLLELYRGTLVSGAVRTTGYATS